MTVFDAILTRFNIAPNPQRVAVLKFVLTRKAGLFSLAELKHEFCQCPAQEEDVLTTICLFERHHLVHKYYEDQTAEGYVKDVSTYFICSSVSKRQVYPDF